MTESAILPDFGPPDPPRDVWCSRCPAPAIRELVVTDGARIYTASYCGRCIARVTLQSAPAKEAHRHDVRTDHR